MVRFYFHIDASTKKENKSFKQKHFDDLVRYFFVTNPVLRGTIVLEGNAAM